MNSIQHALPFRDPPAPTPHESRNILLIVNPVSGRMKIRTGLVDILDELYRKDPVDGLVLPTAVAGPMLPNTQQSGQPLGGEPDPERRVTVIPTQYRGHATKLAANACYEDYDTVICCGGDGTYSETVAGLLTVPPDDRIPIGYIPAGSTNDFAASIGLPGTLRSAARFALGTALIPLDIGLFASKGDDTCPKRCFTYIASFGAFTAASYSTSQTAKNLFGHLAYLVEGIKDIAKIQPRHAVFSLSDGKTVEGDFAFGAVTNTTSAGGVLKLPSDLVSLSDGYMELLLIRMPKTPLDLQKIASALLARDFENCPLVELYHVESVQIELDENLSWSLDGEEASCGSQIEIRCLAGAVRLKTVVGE